MIKLRKLAEQQKNHRTLINKNRILKQTHDIILAESLSPITKKLEKFNETTKKMGEVIEKSQPENITPQAAIEHSQHHQPIEKIEGVIYDTELENTLKNMKNKTGLCRTNENRERGWIWNGYLGKIIGGTEVEINDNKYNITPGIQKVLVDSKYKTAKSMNDKDKVGFRDMLQKTKYYDGIPTKKRMSGCDKYIENDLDNDVRRILKLDAKLIGKGI